MGETPLALASPFGRRPQWLPNLSGDLEWLLPPDKLGGWQDGFIQAEKKVSKPLPPWGRGLERGQNLWF